MYTIWIQCEDDKGGILRKHEDDNKGATWG